MAHINFPFQLATVLWAFGGSYVLHEHSGTLATCENIHRTGLLPLTNTTTHFHHNLTTCQFRFFHRSNNHHLHQCKNHSSVSLSSTEITTMHVCHYKIDSIFEKNNKKHLSFSLSSTEITTHPLKPKTTYHIQKYNLRTIKEAPGKHQYSKPKWFTSIESGLQQCFWVRLAAFCCWQLLHSFLVDLLVRMLLLLCSFTTAVHAACNFLISSCIPVLQVFPLM